MTIVNNNITHTHIYKILHNLYILKNNKRKILLKYFKV